MTRLSDDLGQCEHCSAILGALAHPLRLRIVAILTEGEENVSGMTKRMDVRQSAVSQHLRILRMSGLVASRRSNGFVLYRLTMQPLHDLIACIERCSAS